MLEAAFKRGAVVKEDEKPKIEGDVPAYGVVCGENGMVELVASFVFGRPR